MKAQLIASWGRLRALLAKEFMQLLRDPRMRFTLIVPPLIQLFVFGYAATFDVRHADLAVVNHDDGQQSRNLLSAIAATGHYTLRFVPTLSMASAAMDRGAVGVIVQIPTRFSDARRIELIADGSDPNTAQLVVAELTQVIGRYAAAQANYVPPVTVEERAWFNPNLEDRWFFIPGIMANVLFVSTMMLTAMMVVREREIGTLERLMVTPVGRLEFLVGKMVPVACVGLFDVALITTVALLWFGVPLRGSVDHAGAGKPRAARQHPGARPADFQLRRDAATGDAERDVLHHADDGAFGVCVSDPQHAGSGATAHLGRSASLLPGDRTRHLP